MKYSSPSWPCIHSHYILLSVRNHLLERLRSSRFFPLFPLSVVWREAGKMQFERCWQISTCIRGTKLCLFTFRQNIAHAQDSHQVINIAVNALGNSRVLQNRIGNYNVETR